MSAASSSSTEKTQKERWITIMPSKKMSDLCNEIVQRLENDNRRDILAHFDRLPHRYYLNMCDKVEDILMHKRCLELAKDAEKLPIIDIKLIQGNEEIEPSMHPVTQITVATNNRHKLFNKVLDAFTAVNLDVKETYAYQTNDGYALGVFILSGCEYEAAHLTKTLKNELSKFEISKGGQRHNVGTKQFIRFSWTCVQFLFYLIVSLAAAYLLIGGVCLMYGAPPVEADILGFAFPIGKDITGNVAKISVHFLGIVAILFMLLEAKRTAMVMKAKVVIVSWLIIALILGIALLFTEVKVAVIKDKAYSAFLYLVTMLAALTNLHRKDDI